MRCSTFSIVTIFLLSGMLATSSVQAASLSISSSGNNTFQISGGSFTGVATLDITINYDSTTLASPQANAGPLISGALFVANPNTPGSLRLAFITTKPISGSGIIATITFSTIGSGAGQILSMSSQATDLKGKPILIDSIVVPWQDSSSLTTPATRTAPPPSGPTRTIGKPSPWLPNNARRWQQNSPSG